MMRMRLAPATPGCKASPFVDAQTPAELSGQVDATVQHETERLALERVRGTVTLERSELALGGITFEQQVGTRVDLRDGRMMEEAGEGG